MTVRHIRIVGVIVGRGDDLRACVVATETGRATFKHEIPVSSVSDAADVLVSSITKMAEFCRALGAVVDTPNLKAHNVMDN